MAGDPDASRVRCARPGWHHLTPAVSMAVFAAGVAVSAVHLGTSDVGRSLRDVPEFGLWFGLLAAVVGLAGVVCLYGIIWLIGLRALIAGAGRRSTISVVLPPLVVLGLVFGALILPGAATPAGSQCLLAHRLDQTVRPLTLGSGLLMIPALACFLALRRLATDPAGWAGDLRHQMLTLIAAKSELRRVLTVLGGILALLVVTTGMRRRALLSLGDPETSRCVPAESVLLYGLIFAVVLGLFYLLAATALDARAAALLENLEPFPDPTAASFVDRMARRSELVSAMGGSSSLASFQTAVVVAAPLLSALFGIATSA